MGCSQDINHLLTVLPLDQEQRARAAQLLASRGTPELYTIYVVPEHGMTYLAHRYVKDRTLYCAKYELSSCVDVGSPDCESEDGYCIDDQDVIKMFASLCGLFAKATQEGPRATDVVSSLVNTPRQSWGYGRPYQVIVVRNPGEKFAVEDEFECVRSLRSRAAAYGERMQRGQPIHGGGAAFMGISSEAFTNSRGLLLSALEDFDLICEITYESASGIQRSGG